MDWLALGLCCVQVVAGGAVQEEEGMEQLLIAGFVHCPAVSG